MIFLVRGVIGVIIGYKHLIRILLGFEIIMVGLIGVLCYRIVGMFRGLVFIVIFIIIMVGEGVLGLRVMVGIVRWFGEDYCRGVRFL